MADQSQSSPDPLSARDGEIPDVRLRDFTWLAQFYRNHLSAVLLPFWLDESIDDRRRNVSMVSGVAYISTYRRRYRCSASVNP